MLFNEVEIPQFKESLELLVSDSDMSKEYDGNILAKLEEMRAYLEESAKVCNSILLKLMGFSGSSLELDAEYLFTDKLSLVSTEVEIIDVANEPYVGIISRTNAESVMSDKYWRLGEYVEITNKAVIAPSEDYMLTRENSELLFMYPTLAQTMISPLGGVYLNIYDSSIPDKSAVSRQTAENSFLPKDSVLDLNNVSVSNHGYTISKTSVVFSEQIEAEEAIVSRFAFDTGTVTVKELRDTYLSNNGVAFNTGIMPANTNLISNYNALVRMNNSFVKAQNHEFASTMKRSGEIDQDRLIAIGEDIISHTISLEDYTRQPLTRKEVQFIIQYVIGRIQDSMGECL